MREAGDGSCLQMHIRYGIRYLWTISNFKKLYSEQYLESSSLYLQRGKQRNPFNLKIVKVKPVHNDEDNGEIFFLNLNFQKKLLEESQYHIRYCLCDRYGKAVTQPAIVEMQVVYDKIGPFYLNFIAAKDLKEKIQIHETLIIDVLMLDVTFPSLYNVSTDALLGSVNRVKVIGDQKKILIDKNFQKLYNQVSTSDMVLMVKDRKFLVHTIVLTAKSPTLSSLLLPMLQGNETNVWLTIEDFDPAVVSAMLKYMYFGDVTITDEVIFDLYRIAKTYQLSDLANTCLVRIVKSTNVDNAMTVYCFAVKNKIDLLVKCTKDFVRQNIDQVMDSGSFERIINSYDFQAHGI
ncbi:hypothetical protein TSAR_003566 [Trichomalopsis sarcophagae]|uniref:BTB domain-containing protein n=1 Tax=Trichomalopsis sarcophagae TaxID=543379 RepID=A0A232FE42_9HYME|nr:hypothetical protein TSAR_003566 [Trichomalopsis sarcophagae]